MAQTEKEKRREGRMACNGNKGKYANGKRAETGAQYANSARGTREKNNAKCNGAGTITAAKQINIGEEVLYAYGKRYWTEFDRWRNSQGGHGEGGEEEEEAEDREEEGEEGEGMREDMEWMGINEEERNDRRVERRKDNKEENGVIVYEIGDEGGIRVVEIYTAKKEGRK